MRRFPRLALATLFIAAACSANDPLGPITSYCKFAQGSRACVTRNAGDWVNPNGDWVNPNGDWVNPNGDWVNPNGDWVNPNGDWVNPNGDWVNPNGALLSGSR